MTSQEIEQAKRDILEAIRNKDYEVSIEGPNNVDARKRRDGSEYLYIYDMDGVKSSTLFGSCTVVIAEYTFTNDFFEGTWTCDEYDLLDDDEIIKAIEGIDGVLCGQYIYPEDQVVAYNAANGTDIEDFYWWEDDECPMDAEEIRELDDFNWETYEYEDETYHLMDDEINDADEEHEGKRWGIGAYGEPDDHGKFECVVLLFNEKENEEDEDMVIGIMKTRQMLDNDGCLEI